MRLVNRTGYTISEFVSFVSLHFSGQSLTEKSVRKETKREKRQLRNYVITT